MSQEPLQIVSDYACPWCYLGWLRAKRLADEVDIHLVPFQLDPSVPATGKDVGAELRARGLDLDAAQARLQAMFAEEGVTYPTRGELKGWNTGPAHLLAGVLIEAGAGLDLHTRLFEAYHIDRAELSSVDVLTRIGSEYGATREQVEQIVADPSGQARLQQLQGQLHRMGVRSVPTFIRGGSGIQGAQPFDVIREFATR